MTDKRFLYVLDNDEDTIYDLFERDVLSKKDIEDKMNAIHEENKQLQETIEFIFKQIKAFRDDCRTAQYFEGASTITELLRILENVKE